MDTPTISGINWLRAIPHLAALLIAALVVQSLHVFQDWTLNFIAGWALVLLYRYAVRFTITRFHTRGMRFVKAGKFQEAIQAFQQNLAFFERHPNLDKWRSIIFLSPGKYGFREMTLLNLGYCYGQIGDGAKSEQYYRQALDLNPKNGMANAALILLNAKQDIPSHHSPLRHMIADAKGETYAPLETLQEAQAEKDAFVIMEGDWGGQIYLVCPVRLIRCNEDALQRLLTELDKIAWKCNESEGTGLYYERHPAGEGISGGMGGGLAANDLWIHPELVALGLEKRVRDVIAGITE